MDVPSCSSRQIIVAALRLGFVIKKGGKGSHVKLQRSASNRILVVPKTKDLGRGLRTRLVRDLSEISGKPVAEVISLLSAGAFLFLVESLRKLLRW